MAALDFRKPDRVPLKDSFWAEFRDKWRQQKGLPGDADITDYYQVDIDIAVADETPFPSRCRIIRDSPGERIERGKWGRLQRSVPGAYFHEVLEVAVKEKSDLDCLEFEDPSADFRYEAFVPRAEQQKAKSRCVFCKTGGPYLRTSFLRGTTQWLMDIAEDPPFARALAGKVADHLIAVGLESLRRADLWDSGLWVFDDMASNRAPMMSPRSFEQIFLPLFKKMVSAFKGAGARKVILHCDGNLGPLLDMVIEAGFDGINPVEPKAGMDVCALRERYGERLSYIGGMCNAHVLPSGDRAIIERQTRRLMDAAREGGICIGAHSIGPDIAVDTYDFFRKISLELL